MVKKSCHVTTAYPEEALSLHSSVPGPPEYSMLRFRVVHRWGAWYNLLGFRVRIDVQGSAFGGFSSGFRFLTFETRFSFP